MRAGGEGGRERGREGEREGGWEGDVGMVFNLCRLHLVYY